jgi:uncharacterized protein YjbJ (UPF0337 family)
MNKQELKGKWNQFKGQVQERWGELTNDEIDQAQGEYDQLVGRIQERYGIAKEEAQQQVDDWMNKH